MKQLVLPFLLLIFHFITGLHSGEVELKPMEGQNLYRMQSQGPFQLCLECKCCAASTCATMPCCFGIDCQLPNKPYGVCAFVPKTCNCSSCSV